MPLNLDTYLGVQQDALKVQSKRMEVLAKNLANVDTPNYKAQDIDFKTAVAQAELEDREMHGHNVGQRLETVADVFGSA